MYTSQSGDHTRYMYNVLHTLQSWEHCWYIQYITVRRDHIWYLSQSCGTSACTQHSHGTSAYSYTSQSGDHGWYVYITVMGPQLIGITVMGPQLIGITVMGPQRIGITVMGPQLIYVHYSKERPQLMYTKIRRYHSRYTSQSCDLSWYMYIKVRGPWLIYICTLQLWDLS
jgi:hypothetical protein